MSLVDGLRLGTFVDASGWLAGWPVIRTRLEWVMLRTGVISIGWTKRSWRDYSTPARISKVSYHTGGSGNTSNECGKHSIALSFSLSAYDYTHSHWNEVSILVAGHL